MARETIELDLASLTLGEMAAAEKASGIPFDQLLSRGSAHRRMMAIFVLRLRSSGSAPSWNELGDLRPFDPSSSPSDTTPDGAPTPSNG